MAVVLLEPNIVTLLASDAVLLLPKRLVKSLLLKSNVSPKPTFKLPITNELLFPAKKDCFANETLLEPNKLDAKDT